MFQRALVQYQIWPATNLSENKKMKVSPTVHKCYLGVLQMAKREQEHAEQESLVWFISES